MVKPAPQLGLSKAFESPEEGTVTERCKVEDAQRTVVGGSVQRVWLADAAAMPCYRHSLLQNIGHGIAAHCSLLGWRQSVPFPGLPGITACICGKKY